MCFKSPAGLAAFILAILGVQAKADEREPVRVFTVNEPDSIIRNYRFVFGPGGRLICSADKVWDAATGKELDLLKAAPKHSRISDISPDGRQLALFCPEAPNAIRLWDHEKGEEVLTVKGPTKATNAVRTSSFSPNGKLLVTANSIDLVLWDLPSGGMRALVSKDNIGIAVFSPDSRTLATHFGGKGFLQIRLWDTATGKPRVTLPGHPKSSHVAHLAFSSDGKWLASSGAFDRTIRVWDVATGREKRAFSVEADAEKVHGSPLAFSPDGKVLLSGHGSGTIRIWDIEAGSPRTPFKAHAEAITALAFSPDDEYLATGGNHDSIKLWKNEWGKREATKAPQK